jgi:amidase
MADQTQRDISQRANSIPGSEWDYRTLKDLQARKISASELVEHFIRRIEALDQRINAVIVRDFESAREAAKAADAALKPPLFP